MSNGQGYDNYDGPPARRGGGGGGAPTPWTTKLGYAGVGFVLGVLVAPTVRKWLAEARPKMDDLFNRLTGSAEKMAENAADFMASARARARRERRRQQRRQRRRRRPQALSVCATTELRRRGVVVLGEADAVRVQMSGAACRRSRACTRSPSLARSWR